MMTVSRSRGMSALAMAAVMGLLAAGTASAGQGLSELLKQLSADDARTVQGAVKALGDLKDLQAVEPLCALLQDQGREVACRDNVPNSLYKIGDKRAVPALVAALKDPDCVIRSCSQAALAGLGWTPSTDAERASAAVARLNWAAAVATGKAAVEPLLAALKTCSPKSVQVPYAAAEALGKIGWSPSGNAERAMLAVAKREMDEAVKLGGDAVEPLLRLYGCGYLQARNAIEKIGPDAVPALIEIMRRRDALLGPLAAEFLAMLRDPRAVEPLIALVRDANALPQTVRLAAFALGQIRDPRGMEPLKGMSSHKSAACREAAQAALRNWNAAVGIGSGASEVPAGGVKQARLSFLAGLKSPDAGRRASAAAGLGRLRDKSTVEPLMAALKDGDPTVRAAAAKALGAIGDPKSLDALKAAQQDSDKAVCEAAAQAASRLQAAP